MEDLADLAEEARAELVDHILPFWAERTLDDEHGGFVGRIDGHGRRVPEAAKGSVLNARILWTFAAACRALGTDRWCAEADRACDALRTHFADPEHGGVYWTVAPDGTPVDDKKQVYAQAFTIYALAEHVRQRGDGEALAWAQDLYRLLEDRAVDPEHGGYIEAFSCDWGPAADLRLSEKDADAPKSMNTHLHVLEAYTTLYRVWPDAGVAGRLRALVETFLDHIVDPETGHLGLFFGMDWTPLSADVSFGHDVEASWLLDEAAAVLDDAGLAARVRPVALRLARLAREEGLDADGGLFNERGSDGRLDTDKHWWPQAEAVVGFLNAYERTDDDSFAEAAHRTWAFIQRAIVDRDGGEWFFRVDREGVPYREEDTVGPWKCPYHNARACLEIMERAGAPVPP
ncbi:AGE family epimerase/isomerase [Rubrivirga marina]|uniref:Cellobiose 2-epimerase n=1 Tax=Rubrivirga marina TaxID=1196024 RepID=A0A271IXZ0_9BACT|nr:AGE family epimerase/isomerase [Rubrivirga marina]PAP76000.1 N-acyl-D-glucosamine 2-epimerase [Rubrivirga marina]